MAFCPNCKKTYGFTVTICPECNVPLQEDPGDVKIPMFSLQKEEAAKGFIEFAEAQGVSCAYEFSQRENAFKIFLSKKDQKKGPKLFSEYCVNETRKKKGYDAVPNADEIKKAKEEELRKAAEAKRLEEEKKLEALRKAEEERKAEEKRKAEERKQAAEAKRRAAMEARKAEDMRRAKELAEKRKAEEKQKAEEEKLRLLEERRKAAEEERRAARKKAEEEKAAAEAARRKAEEEKAAAEAAAEAARRKELEEKEAAEAARRAEEERAAAAERERRAAEAERLAKEAERKASEAERIAAERKAEAERIVAERKAESERILAERRKSAEERSVKKEAASSPASKDMISLFESKPAARTNAPVMPASNKQFGPYSKPLKDDGSDKHKDILNLFMNPAQSAPKRNVYANLQQDEVPQQAPGSRFAVAPGEDPVTNRPADPFFSNAPKAGTKKFDDSLPTEDEIILEDYEGEEPEVDAEDINLDSISGQEDEYYSSDPDFEPDMSDSYLSESEIPEGYVNDLSILDSVSADPIFVEVEPIKDEDLDAKDIVDAASVVTLENETEEEPEEDGDEDDDAYAAFLTNFKKESQKDSDDILDNYIKDIEEPDFEHSVIEEVLPDREKYADIDDYRIESTSGRPKDIQDTKIKVSADSDIIEEYFDDNVEIGREQNDPDAASSFANSTSSVADGEILSQKAKRFLKDSDIANYSDLEDYKGFVPDYSFEEKKEEVEETPEQEAYRKFTEKVAERKREMQIAADQAKSQQTRKANLEHDLGKGKKKTKIVFEDTDDLDSYAGFIPDYKPNTDNEADFDFYKPHQVSSYAKYKKGHKETSDSSLLNMTHMRATNAEEIRTVFMDKVPNGVKNSIDASLIRSTGFLVSMSGKQLAQLFNSWLILNMTAGYVKQFEQADATISDNTNLKIEGIKNTLRNTFGEINESFLDYIVRRYYGKYLDD